MALFSKLEKLLITGYKCATRSSSEKTGESFEVMFNPEQIKEKFGIEYAIGDQSQGSSGKQLNYKVTPPQDLVLKFTLDGTNVNVFGIELLFGSKTVLERIEKLYDTVYTYIGKLHQPPYLVVEWGDMKWRGEGSFFCRLKNIDINYTLFDNSGAPLRAVVTLTLISDIAITARLAQENNSSPDLTHIRTLNAGDTLASKTFEIYGIEEPNLGIRVAEVNKINNIRRIAVGTSITFPPIAN